MTCIVTHGAHFCCAANGIRQAFSCALIIGRKGNAYMAVIKNRIIWPSEKSLYILRLRGDIDSYTGADCSGKMIVKVGLSYSPESRKEFFNRVIPDGQYGWEILRSTQLDGHALYSCHRVAERGEWAIKKFFHELPKSHLSGEFYLVCESDITKAWDLGRTRALVEENK